MMLSSGVRNKLRSPHHQAPELQQQQQRYNILSHSMYIVPTQPAAIMSSTDSEPEEALTKEEITQQAPAPAAGNPSRPRNAFTELMKPKPKPPPPSTTKQSHSLTSKATHAFKNRDGLGAYLLNPSTFPSSRVIYHNDAFVAIHDLYPKSTVHTLLLPRSPAHNLLHPFSAFEDAQFLSAVQIETARLRDLVARELKRRFSAGSKSDQARAVAIKEGRGGDVPEGRDWLAEVRVGIHAHPSMNHLHVHVFSRDMHSECLKHRNHFNSFNTPFLIDVADFPLREDDPRRHPGRDGCLDRGLKCWRCGREFGNKFKALKEHLEVEFEEWKKE